MRPSTAAHLVRRSDHRRRGRHAQARELLHRRLRCSGIPSSASATRRRSSSVASRASRARRPSHRTAAASYRAGSWSRSIRQTLKASGRDRCERSCMSADEVQVAPGSRQHPRTRHPRGATLSGRWIMHERMFAPGSRSPTPAEYALSEPAARQPQLAASSPRRAMPPAPGPSRSRTSPRSSATSSTISNHRAMRSGSSTTIVTTGTLRRSCGSRSRCGAWSPALDASHHRS
jgi:hypothetical protein